MIYGIVGKRFHECLKKQSADKELHKLSDRDLIHNVCRRERLTFYNYLRMNTINGDDITDESIKTMINREYMFYFKRNEIPDIYDDGIISKLPFMSKFRRTFSLKY